MLRPNAIAWGFCNAFVLAGCSLMPTQESPAVLQVHPVLAIEHGVSKAEQLYRAGHWHHGQARYLEAMAAYREALAHDPLHVDALNALGILYAEQGRYNEAIAEFGAAIVVRPLAAHLHNNLGYALHLRGKDDEAVKAFEQALRLEPGNEFALHNLRLARPQTNTQEVASPATADDTPKTVAEEESPQATAVVVEPNVTLATVAPGIYELVPTAEPAAAAAAAPTRAEAPAPPLKPYKLEVSNGNGVSNMARRVADFLDRHGISTGRLTNAATFHEPRTYIEYRQGYRAEADALAEALPRDADAVEATTLRGDIHLRIVLGQDVRDHVALFEPPQTQAGLAPGLHARTGN
jgi:tetratricopeptide (TPR) repeat protein